MNQDFSPKIEDQNKIQFLKQHTINENSKKNYKFSFKRIRDWENKKRCCIFKFENSDAEEFMLDINPESLRSTYSIIHEYYNYYKNNVNNNINDMICTLLKDKKMIRRVYEKELNTYFLSMKDLLNTLHIIGVDNRYISIAILLYMGFEPKSIQKLKVVNIGFKNREIRISNFKYDNINNYIFKIIVSNIDDKYNMEDYVIKNKKGNKMCTVSSDLKFLNDMAHEKNIYKSFNSKALRKGGALAYYYTHNDKFNVKDKDIQKLKLYKEFGMIKKPSESRFSLCNENLDYMLNIIGQDINHTSSMFDVYMELTENDIKKIKTNSNLSKKQNLLDEMKKSYPEIEREKDDQHGSWYKDQKRIGDEAENLVKNILENTLRVTEVKLMKDYTGYDIQFKLNNEIHRMEVKAINEKLEFYITLNELNNLFNSSRKNFVIAFVSKKNVRILEDVKNNLGITSEFIYHFLKNTNMQMIAYNFKIKLNVKLFKRLKNINRYLNKFELNI